MTRLKLYTNKAETLLETMHELGTAFYAKTGENTYQALYFAQHREIIFEGELTPEEADKLKAMATQVKTIEYDKFNDTWIIEE